MENGEVITPEVLTPEVTASTARLNQNGELPVALLTPSERKRQKMLIMKNILVISCGFLFLFTAYQSLQNLQSSLNRDKGLGLASLCVVYASLILSCVFIPPIMIGRLGCKWTLVSSMLCYILYTVANFYPSWYTLMPASFLLGASAAPLWSAKCAYLTTVGIKYSSMSKETQEAVITRFFGIFFLIFQSGQIWGNLISSLVLGQGRGDDVIRENAFEVCGANDCGDTPTLNQSNKSDTYARPADDKVYTMLGIYCATGICAVILVIALLDKLKGEQRRERDGQSSTSLLVATLAHLKDGRQLLLLPLTFFSGLEQGFIWGDYTASFVTCSIGIHRVGFVMICFGVTDAIFSFLLGKLTKYTGRVPIFIAGFVVHMGVLVTMATWPPDPHMIWVFFLLAAMFGFCDAIWQTQINALYGCFFHDNQEAAFSNYRLWESLGALVAFAYSKYLCVSVKLYLLMANLVFAFFLYLVAELVNKKQVESYALDENPAEMDSMPVANGQAKTKS